MIYCFPDFNGNCSIVYDETTLTTEQKSNGIAVESLPIPETPEGHKAILKGDKATEQVWYEYVDQPESTTPLAEAQETKIAEVTTAYQTELYSTFISSATGIEREYDYSTKSETLWKEIKDTIADGLIPDAILFPTGTMSITTTNNTAVPHKKEQLQQIFVEITVRKLQLYSKWQGMVTANGTILSAQSIEAVEAIAW